MIFHPLEACDNNGAQIEFWNWLKTAFKDDEGDVYYRYPIFFRNGQMQREPDIVLLHKTLGCWVFEVKGCLIENISEINGQSWVMKDFYKEKSNPIIQAEEGMFAVKRIVDAKRELRNCRIPMNFRVILPNIKRSDWIKRGFDNYPCTQGAVCIKEDLSVLNLKRSMREVVGNFELSDEAWMDLQRTLRGPANSICDIRPLKTGTSAASPLRVINAIESAIKSIDDTQHQIAYIAPDGPQRLRGLAGTGKTVLLAIRAAKIHARNPDWNIAFVFFTKSLYEQVKKLIEQHYGRLTEGMTPNWEKMRVMHCWGGNSISGFYGDLAKRNHSNPLSVDKAKNLTDGDIFDFVCSDLESKSIEPFYDAILIDEGQDLPASFYKMAYKSLHDPKRLYWAYDEAQGIGSLIIPDSKNLFGLNDDGSLRVDMSGCYEGGALKSYRMNRCYRTHRQLLMVAHALNMGLYRDGGVLQGVSNQKDWETLGYQIVEGDFSPASVSAGKTVKITRKAETSVHPINNKNFEFLGAIGEPLRIEKFKTKSEEIKWVSRQIRDDIDRGFSPDDILVTSVSGPGEKEYFKGIQRELEALGVKSYIAGETEVNGKRDATIFKLHDHVTISCIYRAKGNEAWKVYVTNLQNINQHSNNRALSKEVSEMKKRNEAFVALTRAKVWCVIVGLETSPIFDELNSIIGKYPTFDFPAFNKLSLSRSTDEYSLS